MTQWRLRLSSYDRQVHSFSPEQGETTWAAACGHSAPVNFLAECPDALPTCTPCLIQFGGTVAARQEVQRAAIAAGVQEEFRTFNGDAHLS